MAKKASKPVTAPSGNHSLVQILPHLYLGPRSATTPSIALAAGITHIISVGCHPAAPGSTSISYHRISLLDSPSANLSTPALLAAEIIVNAKQQRGKVLVHCVAGISRSPAVLAAYLMREEGMTLREALGRLVEKRPAVRPNEGFVQQLREIEAQLRGEESLESNILPGVLRERRAMLGVEVEGSRDDSSSSTKDAELPVATS